MKRAFLFLNRGGDFLGIQQRVAKEGRDCYAWYHPEATKGTGKTGKGLIEIVDDYADILMKYAKKKDELVILIDDNSWGDMCDYLRSEGWNVCGSSGYGDTIEHQRDLGNALAKDIGLLLPQTKKFTDFAAGYLFVQSVKKADPGARFVFKANGVDLAGSSKTYVSKSLDDLDWFMHWVEKDSKVKGYKCESFILSLVVEGLEADYACWYNGQKFAPAVCLTFEQKKLHNLGAAQGCFGQVLTFIPSKSSKFFTEHFARLASNEQFRKSGPNEWAINNIVSEKNHEPYFLEFTPRFGWDSTFGELALLQDAGKSIGDFFEIIATGGTFPKDYFPYGRFSATARLFSESHGTKSDDVKGKPISWKKEEEDNFWWYAVTKTDEDMHEITGNPIGVATACGDTPGEAMAKLYALIKPENQNLMTPDLFHSEYIGEGVDESLAKLKDWGWL